MNYKLYYNYTAYSLTDPCQYGNDCFIGSLKCVYCNNNIYTEERFIYCKEYTKYKFRLEKLNRLTE